MKHVQKVAKIIVENEIHRFLLNEFLAACPDACWRKCWDCGKTQIHHEDITPGVLCRFCGSQDTRLMRKETQALKEPTDDKNDGI